MTESIGFKVTETVRPSEPVVPDPFIAALEPERGARPSASDAVRTGVDNA
jgi:hypothetical protein